MTDLDVITFARSRRAGLLLWANGWFSMQGPLTPAEYAIAVERLGGVF